MVFLEQADLDVYHLSPEEGFWEAETSAKALRGTRLNRSRSAARPLPQRAPRWAHLSGRHTSWVGTPS